MKAILHTGYGAPGDVLQFKDVEKPTLKPNQVLVKIQAASINFGDKALVQGKPFLVRMMGYGLLKPKHLIPGGDIAGQVEAVGPDVRQYRPGDQVFADIGGAGMGAYAEYVAVPGNLLTPKPANLSYEQAASVPQAAVVALQGLRDNGGIQAGHKVLINGASGGVGTFAVQIAKAFDAEVTGVCSTQNLDLVRSIGADHVIDYHQEDFTQSEERYDLVFDIVANRSTSDYMHVLTPTGKYVACAFNPTAMILGGLMSKKDGKGASSLVHKPNPDDLAFMKGLLESGEVVPVIDRSYPLQDLAEAMQYLGSSQQHGKVVITL